MLQDAICISIKVNGVPVDEHPEKKFKVGDRVLINTSSYFEAHVIPLPPLTVQQKLSAEIILNSSITDSLDI